jgi:site-specific DNA-methyltransferase (adenine-specific)
VTWQVLTGRWQDVLPADLRVDHVITDPPYEAEAHTKQRRKKADGTCGVVSVSPLGFEPMTEEERLRAGSAWGEICKRWCLVFCQAEAVHKWIECVDLTYKRTCVWNKIDAMPQLTGDRPACGFESIVCLHGKGRSRWNGGGLRGVFTHAKKQAEHSGHPTEKPISLMLELVSLFTSPGDTILDPYCGSGTTGVACLRLGRHFIGCEMSPTYAQIARDRLTAEEHESTLDALRSGQEALFR